MQQCIPLGKVVCDMCVMRRKRRCRSQRQLHQPPVRPPSETAYQRKLRCTCFVTNICTVIKAGSLLYIRIKYLSTHMSLRRVYCTHYHRNIIPRDSLINDKKHAGDHNDRPTHPLTHDMHTWRTTICAFWKYFGQPAFSAHAEFLRGASQLRQERCR